MGVTVQFNCCRATICRWFLRFIMLTKGRFLCLYVLLICVSVPGRHYYLYGGFRTEGNQNSLQYFKTAAKVHKTKALAAVKYKERQDFIQDYCNNKENYLLHDVNNELNWKDRLLYEYSYGLLYCGIPKVASTTWMTNMMK